MNLKMRNSLFLLLLLATATAFAEPTRYISDDLTVPIRSGTSTKHKILRFLNSGTPVVVLEESGEYSQIRTPKGHEGWVQTKYLMAEPSARVQLAKAGETIQALKVQRKELRTEISSQKQVIAEQDQANQQLQAENQDLTQRLENLQKTAARPVQLEKENRALKQDLENEQQRSARLEEENKVLRDNSIREWFLVGGGVSMGSLILGLIITRIPWRRRRDDWGGF
jgi:SH3 domain protein